MIKKVTFKKLSFRNFLSYGNNLTTIHLERPGTTLILGQDLDRSSEGTGANGVGKSTIINALTYALYDKPISNITKDNLVNNINKKNMEVTIEFEVDDVSYTVKRERKSKAGAAGNNVYLFVNDEDKTLDSAANTNNMIEHILGIEYDLFVRIVVFFASHTPFLDLSRSEQTSMFERLVGLTTLSDKAVELKDIIKETESAIQIHKSKIEVQEKERDRFNTQLTNVQDRIAKWDVLNAQEIANLQAQLTRIMGVDIDQQQSLHDELALINGLLAREFNTFETINNNITVSTNKISKLQNELAHLEDHKCPYCLQQYENVEDKISSINVDIADTEKSIQTLTNELVDIDKIIDQLEVGRDKIQKQLTLPNIKELVVIRNQSNMIEAKIEALQQATNPHLETYQDLLNTEFDPINYEQINKLTFELEHQKFLLKLLTKKDSFVRKALLNKYIPFLNKKLQEYLVELGLPHTVEFTHEMNANISQFGRVLDFGNLSAGQRARVNLSLSLAFRDVLQKLHNRSINICMLDEVLDIGLDTIGAEAAAKLLKVKAMEEGSSVYVISHRDEVKTMFKSTLLIQLIKGFSYIAEHESEINTIRDIGEYDEIDGVDEFRG